MLNDQGRTCFLQGQDNSDDYVSGKYKRLSVSFYHNLNRKHHFFSEFEIGLI